MVTGEEGEAPFQKFAGQGGQALDVLLVVGVEGEEGLVEAFEAVGGLALGLEAVPFSENAVGAEGDIGEGFRGFDDVIEGAGLDDFDGHLFAAEGGEEDDREGALGEGDEVVTAAVGQAEVSDGEGGQVGLQVFLGFG